MIVFYSFNAYIQSTKHIFSFQKTPSHLSAQVRVIDLCRRVSGMHARSLAARVVFQSRGLYYFSHGPKMDISLIEKLMFCQRNFFHSKSFFRFVINIININRDWLPAFHDGYCNTINISMPFVSGFNKNNNLIVRKMLLKF